MATKPLHIVNVGRHPLGLQRETGKAFVIPGAGKTAGTEGRVTFDGADADFVREHRAVLALATGDRPVLRVA